MSPVTGLARLAGRIVRSVHMGNFSSVTEMNKACPVTEISVTGLARLLI